MFFKRKIKTDETSSMKTELIINEVELKIELENLLKKEKSAEIYTKISKIYELLKEDDKAIEYLEKCIVLDHSLGENHNRLMRLYNLKRREAAESKDNDKIQYYMDKIDELMKISKDTIRGKL